MVVDGAGGGCGVPDRLQPGGDLIAGTTTSSNLTNALTSANT
jgi:hypothetical protein